MIMQCGKVAYIEFHTEEAENRKSSERKKKQFSKRIKKRDFYKPVLNKIMTTHEKCV